MGRCIELSNCDILIFVLNDRRTVVVRVQIVRRTEDGDDRWKFLRRCLPMHGISMLPINGVPLRSIPRKDGIPCVLGLMPTEDPKKAVSFQKLTRRFISEEI